MGLHQIISDRLERQRSVGSVWQFQADGATPGQIRHAASQLREVHDGVYLSGHAPLTDWQRWKASTLTEPGTYLGLWAVACFVALRDDDRRPTTVRRIGSGGPRTIGAGSGRLDAIKVHPTDSLDDETEVRDGIAIVSPPRTLLDLIAQDRLAAPRLMRDMLRKGIATPMALRVQVARGRKRNGASLMKELLDRYEPLVLGGTKSDAEALAVDFLTAARRPVPLVNVIVAGGEADLLRPDVGLIVELDGPQFHRFPIEDAEKQAKWESAGLVVRRLPTDDVYLNQHELLSAYSDPISEAERAIAAATRTADDILARWDAGGPRARRRADAAG